jgi:hypothetical protein
MSILLKHIEAVVDLLDGVKVDDQCALENILITEVRAGHTRLVRAEVAVILTTELVWRKGDADIDDAALRANTLVDEDIPEILNIGIVVRVLLNHLAVNHTKLTLSALILILLGGDAQAAIEALNALILGGIHLDDILEDELCLGRVRHKRSGGDILNVVVDGGHFAWKGWKLGRAVNIILTIILYGL